MPWGDPFVFWMMCLMWALVGIAVWLGWNIMKRK